MSYSESRLNNSALYYLQRYASTAANLRRVMQRKLQRAAMRGEEVPPEAATVWLDKVVEKCINLGFVNDRIYAESRIQTLRRQGRARMFILRNLQEKGVEPALIAELLGSDDDVEMEAAIRYVERRRLGRDQSPEGWQKDMGKLLRAGFPMNIARKALGTKKIDEDDFS